MTGITDRHQAEETLRKCEEEARRLAQENAVLAEISRIVSSSLDINDVYEPFAEQVRKLIPFDRLAIAVPDLERGFILPFITGMEVEHGKSGDPIPMEGTFFQEILLSRFGLLLQGVSRKHLEDHLPGLLPNFDAGIRSFLGVPLVDHDDIVGVLHILSKEANAYTDTHLAIAERIGMQISGAIANSLLYSELRRAEEALRKSEHRIRQLAAATVRGHEEERQWAAIEVHDRICQPLVGLAHNIQAIESMASKMRAPANRAFELLRQAIGESRNIMDYLYPPGLEEFGIVPLLEADLHRFHEDTGSEATLDTTLDADSEVMMPQVLTVTLYRIFQEALTNIRRHATGTKMVAVSLRCTDRFVSLEVKDDGAGFDVKTSKPEGRVGGLMIMSRRAEIIGGTLDISSTQGQGTTVTVHVPIDGSNL